MAQEQSIAASFSALTMSIASSAGMFLGLSPHPQTGKSEKDLTMAKFNIDLLVVLQEKTKNNLSQDEKRFLDALVSDLQMKFVQETKNST